MGIINYIFNRGKQRVSYDFDGLFENIQQNAMKSIALETCANYIARTFSKSSFLFDGDNKSKAEHWGYRFNNLANPNQTATEFWSSFVKTLIQNGEALAYVNSNHEMFVADSYVRNHQMTGDTFNITVIQNIPVNIDASREQVLFVEVENDDLKAFVNDLWEDYGTVLGKLLQSQKTANQLRFHMEIPRDSVRERARELANRSEATSDDKGNKKDNFVTAVKKKLDNDSFVPIILPNGSKVSYIEDIAKMKMQYINDVADILGIPNGLIHGDLADNQKNYDTYITTVIEPLAKKIASAMTHIVFTKAEVTKGNNIRLVGFKNYDLFSLSSSIDKLLSSGSFTRNEIRQELGYKPVEGGDKFLLTKNYMELDSIGKDNHEKNGN